jgi:hypothetical protein
MVRMTEEHAYEARYGWNRQSLRQISIALVFCAVVLVISVPLWFRILAIAFFGGAALVFAFASVTGRTAVLVESAGITLCTSPLYPKATTRLYPWEDVTEVVIWRAAGLRPRHPLEYVGVQRRAGAPPLTGRFTGRSSQSAAGVIAPGISPAVAVTGAATNGWRLDRARLAEAVAHFAPAVRLRDTTGQQPTPPLP